MNSLYKLGFSFVFATLVYGQLDTFWYPSYLEDGPSKVVSLTGENFCKTVKENTIAVVLFTLPQTDEPVARREWRINQEMMKGAARVLQTRNVVVGIVNMARNADLLQKEGVNQSGTVFIYKSGSRVLYRGYRSSHVLISYMDKLERSPVSFISNKAQKKSFEKELTTRVVGYFALNSPEYLEFQKAAQYYYPDIPFYAVVDPTVAGFCKLSVPGEIYVIKPFDKLRQVVPENPATAFQIRAFVDANLDEPLTKLTLEDVHKKWVHDPNKQFVVAFVDPLTPDGVGFHKILKQVVRRNANNTQLDLFWIEPKQFPLLKDHWEMLFGVDLDKPALGLVNITNHNSSWFDMAQLDALGTEITHSDQVQAWLDRVVGRQVRVDGLPPAPEPSEVITPVTDTQTAGEDTEILAGIDLRRIARALGDIDGDIVPPAPLPQPTPAPPSDPQQIKNKVKKQKVKKNKTKRKQEL